MPILSALLDVFQFLLRTYLIILFISVILSWVQADPSNPIVRMLHTLTAPPCRWLKRKFPKLIIYSGHSAIDLSPTVLMLSLGALHIFLTSLRQSYFI